MAMWCAGVVHTCLSLEPWQYIILHKLSGLQTYDGRLRESTTYRNLLIFRSQIFRVRNFRVKIFSLLTVALHTKLL